jgi:cyclopropane fatty-acyl-phospholipid synthase-like methyltransferase
MTEPAYGQLDRWQDSARTDEAQMRELAAHIELRGQAADEIATRASYLDLLEITPGQRVLEVGCGSGVVLRDVARRVAPTGLVVGLDSSPTILAIARQLADEAGLADSINLREGDARAPTGQ